MALVTLTVRKRKEGSLGSGKTFASESQVIETSRIIYATPSVCKVDNGYDYLVNSMIKVAGTAGDSASTVTFWVTQDVTAIAALT